MMMSTDYNIPQVLQLEMEEMKNFNFYRLINPRHPDLLELGKRLHLCPDPKQECRLVPLLFSYQML